MRRFLRSVGYARDGLKAAWRDERNFRIELAIGAAAIALTLALDAPLIPILLACGMVLAAELMNAAVEALVDLLSPETHPKAKKAKDCAAASVLVAAVAAALVGFVTLGPPLWRAVFGA